MSLTAEQIKAEAMKRILSALILAGALAAHTSANAQGSTLRVVCKGNDVGAEVTIDGQFKGECPLEARVSAGTVKLRLVKKIDSLHERIFEQNIRLGDGVVKQVDAVLSAPRSMAKGQGRGNTSPAAASAETGRRAQTGTTAAQGSTPPRPPIPLEISEDIWKIIEASEAYRNHPQSRAVKVIFQGKQEIEYTGAKIRSLPNPGAKTISATRVSAPVGDKCTMMLTDSVTDGKPADSGQSYLCGHILLGYVSGGKPMSIISSIDELKGSLFPLRIGARETTRYQMAFLADRKYDSTNTSDCAVVSRQAAQELDPRLKGAAWKVHCKSSYSFNTSNQEKETDDYYLEDLAVMLSFIGAYDTSKKAHVLPSPGTQTLIETEGDYGGRNITSYASHNWETGGVYEVPAKIAIIATPSNDGRPAAAREPAQREQPQAAAVVEAASQAPQAEKPADSDSGFLGALLGGLASKYVDRTAAQINSAAAGTSGAGGVVMGALGGVSTQLASATKEQIAKDMGGNSSMEGMAGALVGNAVGSGSRAGAMAALSGTTSNLTGSARSAGSGASTGGSTSGSGCCSSASERIADNKARGAPDNFETNNERICREGKSRAYCEAGVTERRLSLGGLERFGRPGSGATVTSASGKATAAQEQTCRAAYRGVTDDPQLDWACKNAQFNKCLDEATKIPTYRVQTRTVCMQLDQTLKALNSGTAASYCPLYCGR